MANTRQSKVTRIDARFGDIDSCTLQVRKQINAPLPPHDTLGPFSLADPELLKRSFTPGGFKDVLVESFPITFGFESAETYTRFRQAVTTPIHAMFGNQTEEKKKQAWDAVTDAVSKYADSHGRVNIDNEVICIAVRSGFYR